MGEQDGNSAVFAECKWRNEGALFPVFKNRIYKGMYGKGRENGKCNAGEVCGYCNKPLAKSPIRARIGKEKGEFLQFALLFQYKLALDKEEC